MIWRYSLLAFSLVFAQAAASQAQQLRIDVTNLQPNNGFFLTPVWFAFHNGSFDLFDPGAISSPALEALAEDGIVSGLQADFAASQANGVQGVVLGPGGFGSQMGQPPVLDAGETGTAFVNISNPVLNRYFSYASMIIPSNDAFIGTSNPLARQIFDAAGNFLGPITFDLVGANIWDSGTEVNDTLGAAFSTIGGTSTTENGVVALHPGLGNFLGTGTAAGLTIGSIPGAATPIVRFTITAIPEPSGLIVLALFGGAIAGRRRR